MKKIAFVVTLAALSVATAYAGVAPGTGVNGSDHDMNKKFGTPGGDTSFAARNVADIYGRVCVYCHTPHGANGTVNGVLGDSPLWSHTPNTSTFDAYTWYAPATNATGDNLPLISDPLAGPSRLCMSCHDGVTAANQHSGPGAFDGNSAGILTGRGNIAGDADGLTNDHPIGFDYDAAVAWRNVGTPRIRTKDQGFASSIDNNYVVTFSSPRTIEAGLYNGIMTCATCHDVHNKENVVQDTITGSESTGVEGLGTASATTPNFLLYAKENQSLICLSCHLK